MLRHSGIAASDFQANGLDSQALWDIGSGYVLFCPSHGFNCSLANEMTVFLKGLWDRF